MDNRPSLYEFFPELLNEGDHCAMVQVPPFKSLTDLINKIPVEIIYQPNNPDYGKESSPHVTILYGIESEDEDKAIEILKAIPSRIEVTLGKVSKFTSADYDVLKISVVSPQLTALNKKLTSSVKNTNEYAYSPHVTLAYVKKGMGNDFLGDTSCDGKVLSLDTVVYSDNHTNTKFSIPKSIAEYFVGTAGGYGTATGGAVAASGVLGTYGGPQTSRRLQNYSDTGHNSYTQGNTIIRNGFYDTLTDDDLKHEKFSKDEMFAGFRHEMKKMEFPDKDKAKPIIIANLEKNPRFYSDLGMYLNSDK